MTFTHVRQTTRPTTPTPTLRLVFTMPAAAVGGWKKYTPGSNVWSLLNHFETNKTKKETLQGDREFPGKVKT